MLDLSEMGRRMASGWPKAERGPQPLTVFLVEQLHLLQHVLAHLGEAGAGLLTAAQDQAVLVVACAHAVQGFPEGLGPGEARQGPWAGGGGGGGREAAESPPACSPPPHSTFQSCHCFLFLRRLQLLEVLRDGFVKNKTKNQTLATLNEC